MNKNRIKFSVGEKVFASTNLAPHWPAKVIKVDHVGSKIYYIISFYGKDKSECCEESWIKQFNTESEKLHSRNTRNKKAFVAALEEMAKDQKPIKVCSSNKENEPSSSKETKIKRVALAEKTNKFPRDNKKVDQGKSKDKKNPEPAILDEKKNRTAFGDVSNHERIFDDIPKKKQPIMVSKQIVDSSKIVQKEKKIVLADIPKKDEQISANQQIDVPLKVSSDISANQKIDVPLKVSIKTEKAKVKDYISELSKKMEVKYILLQKLFVLATLHCKEMDLSSEMEQFDKICTLIETKLNIPEGRQNEPRRRTIAAKPAKPVKGNEKIEEMYKSLKSENIFIVKKSKIQGKGAFAIREIMKGELIAVYEGEVITKHEADAREIFYRTKKMADYMFALPSAGLIVDATEKGNDSKFINHCCQPNADVKSFDIDGEERLLFFTKRRIKKDDEITIDYKFPDEKVVCKCGAMKCRQYLN